MWWEVAGCREGFSGLASLYSIFFLLNFLAGLGRPVRTGPLGTQSTENMFKALTSPTEKNPGRPYISWLLIHPKRD